MQFLTWSGTQFVAAFLSSQLLADMCPALFDVLIISSRKAGRLRLEQLRFC